MLLYILVFAFGTILGAITATPTKDKSTDNSTTIGEWLEVGHDDTTHFYRCSICGHEEHDNMTKHDKFCSSCGHPMK